MFEFISTGAGNAVIDAVKLAAVWINIVALVCTDVFIAVPELLSVPDADVVNVAFPAPEALYVHVKYALAPAAIDAAGVATAIGVTLALPFIPGNIGATLFTIACPLFVTDNTICITCPMLDCIGDTLIADAKFAALCTVITLLPVTGELILFNSVSSAPFASALTDTTPAWFAAYIHVKLWFAPAVICAYCAGVGPDTYVSTLPLVSVKFSGITLSAGWPPAVAVTFIIIVTSCPTDAIAGIMFISDVRCAADTIATVLLVATVLVTPALVLRSTPVASPVKSTLPTVFAVNVHVKYSCPPPTIETPALGTAPVARVTLPITDPPSAATLTLFAVASPVFVTDAYTVISYPVPTVTGNAFKLIVSTAGVWIVIVPLVTFPVDTFNNELASIPAAEPCSVICPLPCGLYIHV
jgi:hypothetical protein